MCSCVAKVTAPPPPTVSLSHTHMQTHTRTVLNHFDFAKCGRNFGECSSPHGQTGKETSKCSSVSGKHTHAHTCVHTPVPLSCCCIHLLQKIYSSWQWQFNCHAAPVPEPCQSPAAAHRLADKSFTGATSIHLPLSVLPGIAQCEQVTLTRVRL